MTTIPLLSTDRGGASLSWHLGPLRLTAILRPQPTRWPVPPHLFRECPGDHVLRAPAALTTCSLPTPVAWERLAKIGGRYL